jgi:hypothetical protein
MPCEGDKPYHFYIFRAYGYLQTRVYVNGKIEDDNEILGFFHLPNAPA